MSGELHSEADGLGAAERLPGSDETMGERDGLKGGDGRGGRREDRRGGEGREGEGREMIEFHIARLECQAGAGFYPQTEVSERVIVFGSDLVREQVSEQASGPCKSAQHMRTFALQ